MRMRIINSGPHIKRTLAAENGECVFVVARQLCDAAIDADMVILLPRLNRMDLWTYSIYMFPH